MNSTVFLILLFSCFTSSYSSVDVKNWEEIFDSLLEDKFYLDSLTDNARLQEYDRLHKRDISDGESQQNDEGNNVSPDDQPPENNKDSSNTSTLCDSPENWTITWNNRTTPTGMSILNLKIISGNSDDCFGEMNVTIFLDNSNNGLFQMESVLMTKNGTLHNKTLMMNMVLQWRSEKCAMGCENGSNHLFLGSVHYQKEDSNFSRTDASWMYSWNDHDNETKVGNFQKSYFLAIKGGNVTERSTFSCIWTPTAETTTMTDYKIGQGIRSNISSWRKDDQFGPWGRMGGYGGWGNSGQHWGFGGSQNTFGTSQINVEPNSFYVQGTWGTHGTSQTQGTWANSGSHSSGGTYQTGGSWGNGGPHSNPGTYQAQGTWANSGSRSGDGTYQTQGSWGNGGPHSNPGTYQAQGTWANSGSHSTAGTYQTHDTSETSHHTTDSNYQSHSTLDKRTNGKSSTKTAPRGGKRG